MRLAALWILRKLLTSSKSPKADEMIKVELKSMRQKRPTLSHRARDKFLPNRSQI